MLLPYGLQALKFEPGTHVVSSGALATTSGKKTGEGPLQQQQQLLC
jgi:hypothetical protein